MMKQAEKGSGSNLESVSFLEDTIDNHKKKLKPTKRKIDKYKLDDAIKKLDEYIGKLSLHAQETHYCPGSTEFDILDSEKSSDIWKLKLGQGRGTSDFESLETDSETDYTLESISQKQSSSQEQDDDDYQQDFEQPDHIVYDENTNKLNEINTHISDDEDEDNQILGHSLAYKTSFLQKAHTYDIIEEESLKFEAEDADYIINTSHMPRVKSTNSDVSYIPLSNKKFSSSYVRSTGDHFSSEDYDDDDLLHLSQIDEKNSHHTFPKTFHDSINDDDEILGFAHQKGNNTFNPNGTSFSIPNPAQRLNLQYSIPRSLSSPSTVHRPLHPIQKNEIPIVKNSPINSFSKKQELNIPKHHGSTKYRYNDYVKYSNSTSEVITIDNLKNVISKSPPKWLNDTKKKTPHKTSPPPNVNDDSDDDICLAHVLKKNQHSPTSFNSLSLSNKHSNPNNVRMNYISKIDNIKKPKTPKTFKPPIANIRKPPFPLNINSDLKLNRKLITRIFVRSSDTHTDITLYPKLTCADIIAKITSELSLDISNEYALFEINKTLQVERPIFEWEFPFNAVSNWFLNKNESYTLLIKPYPYTTVLKPSQLIGKFINKEGYLKREVSSKKWKYQYFVLKKGILYVYPNDVSTNLEYSFNLSNRNVYTSTNYTLEKNKKRIVFSLVSQIPASSFCNSKDRTQNFDALDEQNLFTWVTALRIAVAKNTFITTPSQFVDSPDEQIRSHAQQLLKANEEYRHNK